MDKKEATKQIRIRESSYNNLVKAKPRNENVVDFASDAIDKKAKQINAQQKKKRGA